MFLAAALSTPIGLGCGPTAGVGAGSGTASGTEGEGGSSTSKGEGGSSTTEGQDAESDGSGSTGSGDDGPNDTGSAPAMPCFGSVEAPDGFVVAVELNGDGVADLAVALPTFKKPYIDEAFVNDGLSWVPFDTVEGVKLGTKRYLDVDADGLTDAAFGLGTAPWSWQHNDGEGFAEPEPLDPAFVGAVLFDFDHDGIDDLLSTGPDAITVYRRDETGTPELVGTFDVAWPTNAGLTADTECLGEWIEDTLLPSPHTEHLARRFFHPCAGSGASEFATQILTVSESGVPQLVFDPTEPSALGTLWIGDADGDSALDLVAYTGEVRYLQDEALVPGSTYPGRVALVTDLEPDGLADAVVGDPSTPDGYVVSLGTGQDLEIPGTPVAAADFDGDGDIDIVTNVARPGVNELLLFEPLCR